MSRHGDWIQTYTGVKFWPLDPRPEEIFIIDIAHALSLQCRYAGHCLSFYSVAEHSVLLSEAVPPQHAKAALLHDATETYLQDVVRPVKRSLLGYQVAEARLWEAIAAKYGVPAMLPAIVKEYDTRILADEREQNMMPTKEVWSTAAVPLGVKLRFYDPAKARTAFLRRFGELFGRDAMYEGPAFADAV